MDTGQERSARSKLAKFGSDLVTIWPNLAMKKFFTGPNKKLSKCVGLVLRVALPKK